MDFKYLNIDDSMIRDVISLFDGDNVGGTSSLSLKRSLSGENVSVVLCCLQNGLLVGAVEFSEKEREVVRIRNIVVDEKFRKQGIGTSLLKKSEEKIVSEYKPKFIKTIPMAYSYGIFKKLDYIPDRESEYDWVKSVGTISGVRISNPRPQQ